MANANWQGPHEWSEWCESLAAGLHGRCRWRLPVLLMGVLYGRTMTKTYKTFLATYRPVGGVPDKRLRFRRLSSNQLFRDLRRHALHLAENPFSG